MTGSLRDIFQVPGHQQIRGKKRLAKISTVKVHLLQNVPGYGRRGNILPLRHFFRVLDTNLQQGAVIPVTPGMMRNIWFPKKMAEYLTTARLQQLGVKKDTAVERDSTFRSNTERKLDKEKEKRERKNASVAAEAEVAAVEQEPVVPIELELLSVRLPTFNLDTWTCLLTFMQPERSMAILDDLLPPNLAFYRTPIETAPPTLKRVSPSIPATSIISAAAAEGKEPEKPAKTSIYGSVTTGDISANLKAILAENEDGVRVILSPEDISFVEETDDKDRVKHLGIFEIEIKLNGAQNAIRRTIQVNA